MQTYMYKVSGSIEKAELINEILNNYSLTMHISQNTRKQLHIICQSFCFQYVDDDELEGEEGVEKKAKKVRPKRGMKASATYEPEALSRAFMTEQDNIIRSTDMPERFQLRQIPVKETEEGELDEEAEWIYKQAFNNPTCSKQVTKDIHQLLVL